VRFVDFLRTAVLLFAGAGTALAVVTIAGATAHEDRVLIYVAVGWWAISAVVGLWLGRRAQTSTGIARLMAGARASNALPELEPGAVLFNRLWSLALVTIIAGGVAFLIPQVPAAATGYTLIAALAWRKQSAAVEAVEGRDGVRFYVDRISPFKATQLIRTPGFRRIEPPEDVEREAKTVG
jgi:hypothetical protein